MPGDTFNLQMHALLVYPTDAAASRAFGSSVNRPDPQNMHSQYPADFELYCLGSYDSETGVIYPESKSTIGPDVVNMPRFVVRGDSLAQSQAE